MEPIRVGFGFCGSFCTYHQAMTALEQVHARYGDVTPIVSEASAATDSRFGPAHEYMREMERICGKRVIDSIPKAEPIGPKHLLDVLVICPCTGNTLAKLANGITDTTVTMAAKAHLRNGGPVVLCMATNDGLAASARNIGTLLDKKHVYFVPFGQDDPAEKPTSLVADFSQVCDAIDDALRGEQLQPLRGRGKTPRPDRAQTLSARFCVLSRSMMERGGADGAVPKFMGLPMLLDIGQEIFGGLGRDGVVDFRLLLGGSIAVVSRRGSVGSNFQDPCFSKPKGEERLFRGRLILLPPGIKIK